MHTYTLINKEGRVTYVKFHWQPALGECPLPVLHRCLSCVRLLLCLCSFWSEQIACVESAVLFDVHIGVADLQFCM